jgi:WD40 repeat protein
VNFVGQNCDYIVSGSDDGNIFIWDKKTSEIVNCMLGLQIKRCKIYGKVMKML